MIDIVNGDAKELLKSLNDESIDCIVTDPPYRLTPRGITQKCSMGGMFKKGNKLANNGKQFTYNDISVEDYASEFYRVLKDRTHCYVMTNDTNIQEMLNEFTRVGFNFVKLLVWDKRNKICNQYYMNQCEYILFLRKGTARFVNDCGISNLISIDNIGNKTHGHPTEKPVELMKLLVSQSTNEGDLVLDPFVGVGATPVACKLLNRNFIGTELDENYYKTAMERLDKMEIKSKMELLG